MSVCSDHNGVIVKLTISYNERGPGYWKMNNELLKNDTINTNVRHSVNEVLDNYKSKSHAFVWETIKIRIKELAIRISIQVGKQRNHYKYEMQRELDQINNEKDITDKNTAKRKQELECKLNEIYVKETKGAQLQSKSKYIENGEILFKYFKSLEKTHQSKNVIECLQTDSGEQICESNLILAECSNFYRDLYKSDCIDNAKINDYLESSDLSGLSASERDMCDMDITEKEVDNAVVNLKKDKSPGYDGLSAEFYQKHWDVLKKPFMNMLRETYGKGEMPETMNQSVVTLIFKKGDRQVLKNYRPICLNNYDYKIVAFVLAKRIQNVIKSMIHSDQSAYIKGRYIGINARYIADFCEYCEKRDVPGIVLSLDFEKVFDRLDRHFMYKILESFNFGERFVKWIRILYKEPKIMIKNNGWISKSIITQRGIRQGCPVSALLFIIANEVMAVNIRNNSNIKGFCIRNKERK